MKTDFHQRLAAQVAQLGIAGHGESIHPDSIHKWNKLHSQTARTHHGYAAIYHIAKSQDMPRYYLSDLDIDRYYISLNDPSMPFLWSLRESGTDLVFLDVPTHWGSSRPNPQEYPTAHVDSINRIWPENEWYYYDGHGVLEGAITHQQARSLAQDAAQRLTKAA